MARLTTTFSAKAAAEENLIPAGVYSAALSNSAIRINDDGEEEILVVQMSLAVAPGETRSVYEWLAINSSSENARRINRKKLADLLTSIGMSELTETEDLIGKELRVRVLLQTHENHEPRNRYYFLPPIE